MEKRTSDETRSVQRGKRGDESGTEEIRRDQIGPKRNEVYKNGPEGMKGGQSGTEKIR